MKSIFTILLFLVNLIYAQGLTTITFNPTDEIFFNPERGFYADAYSPITSAFVNSVKAQNISVIHRLYSLESYRTTLLSQSFLDLVSQDLATARAGGVKVAMRFSYTDNQNGEDAALDTILLHISQLQPVFEANEDVIAFVDAGFIGAWGEWYYSSHGLNNTNDRRTVLFALLDALPKSVDVVIRTPNYKRLIYNNSEPLSPDSAFSGSNRARTGAHNDCFLADATDMGTYLYGDVEGDKNYLNADNRFVPQSGETCSVSEYCQCDNALTDLARMHWSVLNRDYNTDVLQIWIDGGCMPEIKRRLGYRFQLNQAEISSLIKPNGIFTLNFQVVNLGFANPYKPRGCEVILRNSVTRAKYKLVTDVDPRFWYSGDTSFVEITGGIPDTMPEGSYEAFLFLPDTASSLHDRKDYAVRFANENVWEDSTGYNSLLQTVEISQSATGDDYTGENYFVQFDGGVAPPPPTGEIIIDGSFEDWASIPQLDTPPDNEETGDALNDHVDIKDIWVTNSQDELYISYSLAGAFGASYFYHVFFDTDNNPATGFHSGDSYGGFDFMIENSSIYSYSGSNGEWGWTYLGSVVSANGENSTRTEIALPFTQLGISGGETIGLVFNVNDNNDSVNDDYAPDSYQEHSYNYHIIITDVENNIASHKPRCGGVKIFAYPNPFNGIVNIKISNIAGQKSSIKIYDTLGRLVKTFPPDNVEEGVLHWHGKNDWNSTVNSGVYFLVVQTNNNIYSEKLIYLK